MTRDTDQIAARIDSATSAASNNAARQRRHAATPTAAASATIVTMPATLDGRSVWDAAVSRPTTCAGTTPSSSTVTRTPSSRLWSAFASLKNRRSSLRFPGSSRTCWYTGGAHSTSRTPTDTRPATITGFHAIRLRTAVTSTITPAPPRTARVTAAYPTCDCTTKLPPATASGYDQRSPAVAFHASAMTASSGSTVIHGFHGLRTTSGPTAQINRPATTIDHATSAVPPRRCPTHATIPIAIAAVSSEPWLSARALLPRRRYGTASQSNSNGPGWCQWYRE